MVKKRLLCISFLLVTIFTIGCFYSQQVSYKITSQPILAKDGAIIAAEEREIIRALIPFFSAITNNDIKKMKEIWPSMQNTSNEQVVERFASVKSYMLKGLENVSFDGEKLKAKIIYSGEIIEPGTVGKNIAPFQSDIVLVREGNAWVISEWTQMKGNDNMKYFVDMLTRFDRAEKRYGVKDLSKWDGL